MTTIQLGEDNITQAFTAGAAITDGEAVALTGDNQVSPATNTEIQECIGITDEAAAAGEPVDVVILGKKSGVTADGAITAGNPLVPAVTAGRVVAEATNPASHTHTMPTHSHTAMTVDADASVEVAEDRVSFVALGDGAGTFPVENIDVAHGGAAAADVTLPTSADDPGNTTAGDAAPENARAVAVATTGAAGAGDAITVLVGAKSG